MTQYKHPASETDTILLLEHLFKFARLNEFLSFGMSVLENTA